MPDEIRAYQTAVARAVYKVMREQSGCPPVISMKLSSQIGWYVEMKDGSYHIDSVPESQATNVWEAKCECIRGWIEQQEQQNG